VVEVPNSKTNGGIGVLKKMTFKHEINFVLTSSLLDEINYFGGSRNTSEKLFRNRN
jgi:hypothetical protein